MDIDDAIDRLSAACESAGLPGIRPPFDRDAVEATIREIVAHIAPLRLPDELVRLWRRVDPRAFQEVASSGFLPVADSLERLRVPVGEGGLPRILLTFAYADASLAVELDDGTGRGGMVFEFDIVDFQFRARFHGVDAFLDQLAAFVSAAASDQEVDWDPRDWYDAARVRMAATEPDPRYLPLMRSPQGLEWADSTIEIDGYDMGSWPRHWIQAESVDAAELQARGATTTIAALNDAVARGEHVEGTVQAEVVDHPHRIMLNLTDGTGRANVVCYGDAGRVQPRTGGRYEFDLAVRSNREGTYLQVTALRPVEEPGR